MTDVRRLNQRRRDKRLRYAGLRESEGKLFERVRLQGRRTMLRGTRHAPTSSQHRRIATAESQGKGRVLSALLAMGKREVQWSVGAELAKGVTHLKFPPAPEPQTWDELDAPRASTPEHGGGMVRDTASLATTFTMDGEVVEVLSGYGLAHVRAPDGTLYGLNGETPGICFTDLRVGQHVRVEVASRFGRVLHAQIIE